MMPPRVLQDRGRIGANLVIFLAGVAMFATFYFLTLYMQAVRGYSPMRAGLAFLPSALGIGLASGGIGPRLLAHISERTVIAAGLAIAAAGMAWLSLLSAGTNPFAVLLPAQLVAGVGLGLTLITVIIVGVRGVAAEDSGIASGLVNASRQVGGALGLAVLAAIAVAVTDSRLPGAALPDALTDGYRAGFTAGAVCYLAALVTAALTFSTAHPYASARSATPTPERG